MNSTKPPIHTDQIAALRHVARKRRVVLAALATNDPDLDLARQIMDEDHELLAALAKGEPPTKWQRDEERD